MCLDQKENFLPFGSVASLSSSSPRSLAPASTSSPLAVPAKQFSQIIKMQQLFSTFTAEQPRDILWADRALFSKVGARTGWMVQVVADGEDACQNVTDPAYDEDPVESPRRDFMRVPKSVRDRDERVLSPEEDNSPS